MAIRIIRIIMVIMVIRVMGPKATLRSVWDSPEARERLQSPWMGKTKNCDVNPTPHLNLTTHLFWKHSSIPSFWKQVIGNPQDETDPSQNSGRWKTLADLGSNKDQFLLCTHVSKGPHTVQYVARFANSSTQIAFGNHDVMTLQLNSLGHCAWSIEKNLSWVSSKFESYFRQAAASPWSHNAFDKAHLFHFFVETSTRTG